MGFQFRAVFGIFETRDFDITIPVESEINEIIIKTHTTEYTIWSVEVK